jgi:uncharacterized protein
MLIPRNLKTPLLDAAKDTPVVMLNGARQTGKSTLMAGLISGKDSPEQITLDDFAVLESARSAPKSFIQQFAGRVIIDEIQKLPELLLPIKESIDRNRVPGKFFLTGSADVLTLPKVSESLAGRMEIHTLWPLSQGEIRGVQEDLIDVLFSDTKLPKIKPIETPELLEIITIGGYPEVVKRTDENRRTAWFRSYITSILERDVRDLSNIEGLKSLPNLLALIASRTGGLLNMSDLARSFQLTNSTLKRYLVLLETVYLVVALQPWSRNLGKRLVKSPKLYLNDTGLLCHLLECNAKGLERNRQLFGFVFENFVLMELMKQIAWSKTQPKVLHFRMLTGQEVDIVLESRSGRLVGIECKASSTVKLDSFKGLQYLKEQAGKNFHRGIVIYTGSETLSFGEDLTAVPVSALWEISSQAAPVLG